MVSSKSQNRVTRVSSSNTDLYGKPSSCCEDPMSFGEITVLTCMVDDFEVVVDSSLNMYYKYDGNSV